MKKYFLLLFFIRSLASHLFLVKVNKNDTSHARKKSHFAVTPKNNYFTNKNFVVALYDDISIKKKKIKKISKSSLRKPSYENVLIPGRFESLQSYKPQFNTQLRKALLV